MAITTVRRSSTATLAIGVAVTIVLIFIGARALLRNRIPIRVQTVERGNLKSTVPTNGKVEPQFNFEAHAPFPGVVKAIDVHQGDLVPAGKLLLSMDDSDARAKLASAYAALKGAQANYDAVSAGGTPEDRLTLNGEIAKAQIDLGQAQHDLAALQKLQATGAASPSEVAAAQERLQADQSTVMNLQQRRSARINAQDVVHAKATLAEARQAYTAAQSVIAQSDVHAPFAGTVYAIPVSVTEYVQNGSLLLQMADLHKLQVRAYFDEPEIGKLAVGQSIVIHWDAKPDMAWHGHIVRLPSTIITYGTRNVGEVLVAIDDADGVLIPNTNVRVTVTVSNLTNVLVVPREALHIEQGKPYVYRVVDNKLRRTPVSVGALNLTDVQITGGLREGQLVALSATNGQTLEDDAPVEVEK
jgi:HlyD family secretion protein